ncbi:tRNA (guanosine(46)-N7)-methyltransferase TrmB [Candidatus Planktophila lacus]|uniref:tRNA (guanosine(46)-N7)-methyltransferase TrmB n=1 Tax=Candidatus Planktophila lacus TaxID=1884913 RepID=UPI001CBBCEE1|nr:tRNA (guanosine(46)-N7)-methyltransferase TrmB [Candidatus Planktophila lacus]
MRITPAQQIARDTLWAKFGIEFQESLLDLSTSFAKARPVVMEIGYGMGEATWQIAKANPDVNYLGVEVHMPGVGKLMAKLNEYELTNVKLIERDVFEVFHFMISDGALDGVHLYFPDPWPKKRHFKRRIVNHRFISEVAQKLKPGGYLHIATDWVPYAEWITEQFNESTLFTGGVIDRPESRPLTRFEGQGLTKDHRVTDFLFRT